MITKPEKMNAETWRQICSAAKAYAKPHRHAYRYNAVLDAYKAGAVNQWLTIVAIIDELDL
jgi:hypothetical protein